MGAYWQLVFVSCLLVQSLSAEDSAKDNSTSPVNDNTASAVNDTSTSAVNTDEELEKNIGQRIASLQEMGEDEIHKFSDLALEYFNSEESSVFTTLEDPTVTVKKAIGSIVTVQLMMEKTNCTRKYPWDSATEGRMKYCGPLAAEHKEQLECKFDIFINTRFERDTVVSNDCKPVRVLDDSFIYLS